MTAPLRVLHVGKYYPPARGGIETFLADLLPALERRGIRTAAIVHEQHKGDHILNRDRRQAVTVQDVPPVYRVPSYGQVIYTPISPAFPLRLMRAIRDFRPDLLHLHLPNVSAFWALALPAARRLPWIVHWHSDVGGVTPDRRLDLAYRAYRPPEQRLLARSRRIVVSTPAYLEGSTALAPWKERCRIIPLGIDPARLPDPDADALAWAESQWRGRGGRVLCVGRLTGYKGHETLIRTAEHIPDAHIVIVGSGELEDRLRDLIAARGLSGRITLSGDIGGNRLSALYRSCDLLCLPSLDRAESFGLVQLEAMRFGKPVVVSDIPGSGVGWVAREAGNGLTVPPGDIAALSGALSRLLGDRNRRDTLGANGRAALRNRFHIDTVAGEIADCYGSSDNRMDIVSLSK